MRDAFNVIYSADAVNDLRNIYRYIAFELLAPDAASSQVNRIREEIRSLSFMPDRYAGVDWEPWKSRNTHKVPVDNFVVFYMVNTGKMTVTVLRIFYSGQDIDNILKTLK